MTEEPLLPKTQSDSLDFITLLIYCATISSITVFLHDYILDRHLGACRITAEIKNDIHLLNVDAREVNPFICDLIIRLHYNAVCHIEDIVSSEDTHLNVTPGRS